MSGGLRQGATRPQVKLVIPLARHPKRKLDGTGFRGAGQMLTIDGSRGEGGGQILRTALALSIITQQAVRFVRLRAGRERPGLQRQHLAAVMAAARISQAAMKGAELRSQELEFWPGPVRPGDYQFDIGSAGSTTLVLQTILPPLMLAAGPSTIVLEGGTHNPWAPPFEHLAESFLPILERIGLVVRPVLERYGFAPTGGGRVQLNVEPAATLSPVFLDHRGQSVRRWAEAIVSRLPRSVADREVRVLRERLGWPAEVFRVREIADSPGPGNIVLVRVASEHVTELVSSVGQKGLPAEEVARDAAEQAKTYLASDLPVGEHLADQLLLPMALAGGGSFVTSPPSQHALTNREVIGQFLPVPVDWVPEAAGRVRVQVGTPSPPEPRGP